MFLTRHEIARSMLLALILAWASGSSLYAQETSPGLSSGSGQGTGTGRSTGVQRSGAGSMSGVGPGPSGLAPLPPFLPGRQRGRGVFEPGTEVRFPNDPYLLPFLQLEQGVTPGEAKALMGVSTELVTNARKIDEPGERCLALQRIANGAIFSNQLVLAHQALEEAASVTDFITIPLVRDQRLIAIVTSLCQLTDALLREGKNKVLPAEAVDVTRVEGLPKNLEGPGIVRLARLEWQRATHLASIVGNPTYRNEEFYRVADNAAKGSYTLAFDWAKPAEAEPTSTSAKPSREQAQRVQTYKKLADEILVESSDIAKKIDRLIWKYRAMVQISVWAADSRQYSRGVELARHIDNAESRAVAMLLLAESQCLQAQSDAQNNEATIPYREAARAVASIQQEGLRGVMARFLIDSLTASGRFDDARACTNLDPDVNQRFVELGTIAESQGRRGVSEPARRWIDSSDVPASYRPALHRRVTAGVLWALEQSRSRESPERTGPEEKKPSR